MNSKLHIDINNGIIDVEGNEKLAKEIYDDFKGQLLEKMANHSSIKSGDNTTPSKKVRTRTSHPTSKEKNSKATEYTPSLLKNLNIKGIFEYYDKYAPKNNPEKILIYLKFLEFSGLQAPYTADQVYTCYKTTKERPPKVFLQAFRDTSGRNYGYISYDNPEMISISQLGETHFDHDLKKKEDKT